MSLYYRVKDEVTFRAIKGKKVYVRNHIPNTEDGVVIAVADPWDRDCSGGYKYRLRDLEPITP